jgi:hypothetical protein
MLGRKVGGLYLKGVAHLDKVEQALGIVADHGGKEIGEGGPIGFTHHGLAATGDDEQATSLEALDGFANGQATDIVLGGQFGFARQHGAWGELAQDHVGQMVSHDAGSRLPIRAPVPVCHRTPPHRYQIPLAPLANG